jgi:hypothetical protein
MMLDIGLGLDFSVGDGTFAFGPQLSLLRVFQPDDELRGDDANILTVGLHFLLDGAERVETASRVSARNKQQDQDRDGILDDLDRCPLHAEDRDGFSDSDGCPDLDNDVDGVPDRADGCPDVTEDVDQVEDFDGCPEEL